MGARAALRVAFAPQAARGEKGERGRETRLRQGSGAASGRDEGGGSRAEANLKTQSPKPETCAPRALGFGVWPLFADARFDGPYLAPFLRAEDVERINVEAVWNALS